MHLLGGRPSWPNLCFTGSFSENLRVSGCPNCLLAGITRKLFNFGTQPKGWLAVRVAGWLVHRRGRYASSASKMTSPLQDRARMQQRLFVRRVLIIATSKNPRHSWSVKQGAAVISSESPGSGLGVFRCGTEGADRALVHWQGGGTSLTNPCAKGSTPSS
jgi:hypothetical protein